MFVGCCFVGEFKVVIKGFYKRKLLLGIAIVGLLLVLCMAVDYADVITVRDVPVDVPNGVKVVNGSSFVDVNDRGSYFVANGSDKVYTVKTKKVKKHKKKKKEKKLPTISMWAKPSVRCGYSYKWYYRTFIDYCPNCGHYNCLLKNPKCVPENEYTCAICDSDFDGVVGKEKYSWSNVYLRKP